MDQRQTTEAELYERAFPPRDLAYYLGTLLNLPVEDIPTVEDLEREQGRIGLPTREQSNRQAGQDLLDWAAQAFGLGSILRGSAAGRQQDLMSKGRGVETFGKEMMDTSRRAQPQRWEKMRQEHVQRFQDLKAEGAERYPETAHLPFLPAEQHELYLMGGRGGNYGRLPPEGKVRVRGPQDPPPDAVLPARLEGLREPSAFNPNKTGASVATDTYLIGRPSRLPSGEEAQYMVYPAGVGAYEIGLRMGERLHFVEAFDNVGQALAKARQMQNRLALAAKDPNLHLVDRFDTQGRQFSAGRPSLGFPEEQGNARQLRLPWEAGDQPWQSLYTTPPPSGRWAR